MFEVRDYRRNRSRLKSSKLARARVPVIFQRNRSRLKSSKLARARIPMIFQHKRSCLKSNEANGGTVKETVVLTLRSMPICRKKILD